jgi:3-oxoacyl-[acyl-carrier protein] reductase
MDLHLKDKVVLVTGGSRGIGAVICRGFAAEGAKVGINCRRSRDKAEALADSIGRGLATPIPGDLGHEADIAPMFDQLDQAFGPVDVLINNAAYCPSGPLESYTRGEWEHTFAVNVTGAFQASQEFIKRLRARRAPGRIVNIASQAAFLGSTSGHLPYDASKGALVSMTRALAREVAPEGIAVNAVAPGMVLTEMVAAIWEQRKEKYLARIPLSRIGQPEEIARVVVFLASEAASYMTGATVDVSGGLLMR